MGVECGGWLPADGFETTGMYFFRPQHCTALLTAIYTTLHYTALHLILHKCCVILPKQDGPWRAEGRYVRAAALHCTAPHCTAHYTSLHYTTLDFPLGNRQSVVLCGLLWLRADYTAALMIILCTTCGKLYSLLFCILAAFRAARQHAL